VLQSDGVPLFIEELTKVALEISPLQESAILDAQPVMAIPNTLQASLMARLDRFPPTTKEVAQIASVIGREFTHGLLLAVAQMEEPVLSRGLDHLVDAELVFRRGAPPVAVYAFKHALVHEAAYESLLRSQRSAMHGRVVEEILAATPTVEEHRPELLGYHCAQAGLIERAAVYYRRAGERSAERAALVETRGHLERGLTLLRALPDGTERRILEAELKLALGRILLSTSGSADVEAGKVFQEAVALCRNLDRMDLFIRALWGYWFNRAHRRQLTFAETPAQELLELAQKRNSTTAQLIAHAMIGITRLWEGRFEEARINLVATRQFPRTDEYRRLDLAIVSHNLDHHISVQLALTLTYLGFLDQAAAEAKSAVGRAETLTHLPSRAIILAAKCRHDWFMRDETTLRNSTAALVEMCEQQGIPFYLALGKCHLGWLAAKDGRIVEGVGLLRAGLSALRLTDAIIWEPYSRGMVAEVEAWAGNLDEAERLLSGGLELSARTGGTWFDAELHRGKGYVQLLRPAADYQAAETSFSTAIAIAQKQSAKLWELRAATDLARLWFGRGRLADALALLAPVHAWFTEGLETPNVKSSATLLAEISASVSRQ
jgi:predicted ATPase